MGRVDILVHNAGINGIPQGGGWDSSAEIYESVMNCNVRGPFLLNQALIPHLAPGSAILFFSTGLAKMTNLPPQTLICAVA
jgi:3-oxoacyl-[acyl-carrier protein] reductase